MQSNETVGDVLTSIPCFVKDFTFHITFTKTCKSSVVCLPMHIFTGFKFRPVGPVVFRHVYSGY